MTGSRYVVVLTGGGLPGQPVPDPGPARLLGVDAVRHDALAQLSELAGGDTETAIATGQVAAALIAAGWRAGYRDAARDHAARAVYVLDDPDEAARFAAFITAEVDPAHVMHASDPLRELLAAYENSTGRNPT